MRWLWIVGTVGLLGAPLGWVLSDELESDDSFCVSCHLAEAPLHEAKMSDYLSPEAANLAASHRLADADFRCISCHRGASWPNRLRVKVVAARDAGMYLLGRFEEPSAMQHPLWSEDCVQCHSGYDPQLEDAFHAFDVHNRADFDHGCVACHQAHPQGGAADFGFVRDEHLKPICRECHEEFLE